MIQQTIEENNSKYSQDDNSKLNKEEDNSSAGN